MKQIDAGTFHATIKELVDAGLQINGQKADVASLSSFGKFKMMPVVGEQKPARGRSAAVYEIKVGSLFSF